MISRQEHEAWDVLLACQGQLRLAPSGHVIGIDMNAALRVGAARGCDLAVLSELLPAAEAGLVEALCAGGVSDPSESDPKAVMTVTEPGSHKMVAATVPLIRCSGIHLGSQLP